MHNKLMQKNQLLSIVNKIHNSTANLTQITKVHIYIFIILLIIGCVCGYAFGRQSNNPLIITVNGDASLEKLADYAKIYAVIQILSWDKYPDEQLKEYNKKLKNLEAELKASGLPDGRFEVYPLKDEHYFDYDYGDYPYNNSPITCVGGATPIPTQKLTGQNRGGGGGGAFCGHIDRSKIDIKTSEISIALYNNELNNQRKYLDKFYSATISSGSSSQYQVQPYIKYDLVNQEKYLSQLEELAISNARKEAENIAKKNKAKIKKMISADFISDNLKQGDLFRPSSDSENLTLKASYKVTFELEYPIIQN